MKRPMHRRVSHAAAMAWIALLACCATPPPIPEVPRDARSLAAEPGTGDWMQRHEELNARAKAGGFDVLFVGDSITQGWEWWGKAEWDRKIAPFRAANFGIGGDRTEQVLWRLDHGNLEGTPNPKVIVLLIGTNNTGYRKDRPEETAAGIGAILARLHARFPGAQILLFAVFPRGASPADEMRKINNEVNRIIARYAGHWNIRFVDINAKLLRPDGTLSEEIMPDLLHPSAKGYAIWADALVPEIQDALKK
jgi:lysophospholipase L1-like esterase